MYETSCSKRLKLARYYELHILTDWDFFSRDLGDDADDADDDA
jgi:hypothetical protein